VRFAIFSEKFFEFSELSNNLTAISQSEMVYCCACGLNVGGIYYPETFDLDDEEIAQLYDKETLPEWQLKVSERIRARLLREFKLRESPVDSERILCCQRRIFRVSRYMETIIFGYLLMIRRQCKQWIHASRA
jgi:hypothetical protein